MSLDELRERIDSADREITAAFERRMAVSREIALNKIDSGLPVLDPARERAVIERAVSRVESSDVRPYVRPLYETIMAASRELQQKLIDELRPAPPETVRENGADERPAVAYLGMPGSFSEEAVLAHLGDDCRPEPVESFERIVAGVAEARWPMGMVPLENSLTGCVNVNLDLLLRYDVSIVGEQVLPVRHFLLGLPGVDIGRIRRVLSHPQALEQCGRFLAGRGLETVSCGSTALAARTVARQADTRSAAIASERAAQLYGLAVLASDIQSGAENYTRFVLIAGSSRPDPQADKLSLLCVIDHTPGSLYHMLEVFARRGLNLLSIASRPVAGEPWHYSFYVDIAGNLADPQVAVALEETGTRCSLLRVLGNYRAWRASDGS
ncbi:MAG: prephenate dehydratase [Clostridiales bacterium]|nr:prephenate dehydratase [Clostridiales bacterium]